MRSVNGDQNGANLKKWSVLLVCTIESGMNRSASANVRIHISAHSDKQRLSRVRGSNLMSLLLGLRKLIFAGQDRNIFACLIQLDKTRGRASFHKGLRFVLFKNEQTSVAQSLHLCQGIFGRPGTARTQIKMPTRSQDPSINTRRPKNISIHSNIEETMFVPREGERNVSKRKSRPTSNLRTTTKRVATLKKKLT